MTDQHNAKQAIDMITPTTEHDEECEEYLHAELKSLRAHKARLDTELAEMRRINRQQMAFFQDAAAFLRSDWDNNMKLYTVTHDITGMLNDDPCFLPRVTGYAERERKP